MPFFAVRYEYVENSDATRDEHRPAHRDWLAAQSGLRLSGPTGDNGGLLIFEGADGDSLGTLLDGDPFALRGVIARRTITEWNPVSGSWLGPLGL